MYMKKDDGAINLITIVGVIITLIIILIILLLLNNNVSKTAHDNNEIPNQARIYNEINNEIINDNPIQAVSTDFDYTFLKNENNKKNMIYSPLSIEFALKMLQEGANGNTYSQINNALGDIKLPVYKNVDKNLSLANGLFIKDEFFESMNKNYIDILSNKYNAEVIEDKFSNALNMNNWIENKSLGLIRKALDDSMIQPNTKAVLVNTLAIDMEWKTKFDTNNTIGKTFYLNDGSEIIATTMNKETSSDNISFYKGNNVTAITMDLEEYEVQQLEFMAIMPDKNLEDYINDISEEKINEINNNLKKASQSANGVKISIPKFKFDYELGLKEDLKKIGITDAFSQDNADFSKMSNKQLYVSEAIHKANIDFSEEGIKAAAVTAFAMTANAAFVDKPEPIEINIDKPFLAIIRDKNSKKNWFVGTVYNPNLWENDKAAYVRNNNF